MVALAAGEEGEEQVRLGRVLVRVGLQPVPVGQTTGRDQRRAMRTRGGEATYEFTKNVQCQTGAAYGVSRAMQHGCGGSAY